MSPREAATELVRRRTARNRLLPFCQFTMPSYESAGHLVLLAEKLEAVERGEITRLMVFMPPRHGKSELCSVRFPAWYLGRNPQRQVIACSYAESLAYTFSYAVRGTIAGPAYQRLWQHRLDTAGAIRWQLAGKGDLRASYIAAGVGGGITGEGADVLVIDDPVKNAEEAASPLQRERVWEWWKMVARPRLQPGGVIVLIMTRWHQNDLAGALLKLASEDPKADQWEVLHFRALDGEHALWPEHYPVAALEATRASIGQSAFEALYQGSPLVPGGNLFKRGWFEIVEAAPADCRLVRFWDMAATEARHGSDPDWTAGSLLGRAPNGTLYVVDMRRLRGTPGANENLVKQTAEMDSKAVPVRMEQEPGSAGVKMIDDYRRRVLFGWDFTGVPSTGSKEVRASPVASQAEAGNIKLVRGPWISAFLDELEMFPKGAHDDQVDALSGALAFLAGARRPVFETS